MVVYHYLLVLVLAALALTCYRQGNLIAALEERLIAVEQQYAQPR